MNSRTTKTQTAMVVSAMLLLTATPAAHADPGSQGSPNPRVIPPNAVYGGHTYGEWQVLANQWIYGIPAPENATIPGNDAMVANGQADHVWFLATGITGSIVERHFTVPTGKALFVFIIGVEWDNVICTQPPTDNTVEQLRALAAAYINAYGDIQVEIDGVPVKDVEQYRSITPVFTMTLPANNIAEYFGCSNGAGTYGPCVADGYALLLPPPSPGEHLIDEKMVQHVVPGDPSQDVQFEFIFHVTVAP